MQENQPIMPPQDKGNPNQLNNDELSTLYENILKKGIERDLQTPEEREDYFEKLKLNPDQYLEKIEQLKDKIQQLDD